MAATVGQDRKTVKCLVKLGGMQCSFCTESIHKALSRLEGVQEVSVSLAHEEALVAYDPERLSEGRIKDTLRSIGFIVRDPEKVRTFEREEAELCRERRRLLVAGAFTLTSLGLMSTMWAGLRLPWMPWAMLVLALAMVLGVGGYILRMAWASLRRGILNQHVLMEAAALGGTAGGILGFFFPSWPKGDFLGAAVFITAYHILSGYVSLLVRTRSSQAVRRLLSLQPATARVVREGREEEVAVEEVRAGDMVRVRPGEGVPADGVVVEGHSFVDQSLVTGEPIPVEKGIGDEVIGGSVNTTGALLVQVTRVGEESFLRRVARAVEEARALKPGVLMLVERVLKFFVPGVLLASALGFLLWTLGAWAVTGAPDLRRAVFASLAALVMGYPCALGMATPLAIIRGSGAAALKGILLRSGEAFQVFKDVRGVVLDKTGTLTLGKPRVEQVVALDGSSSGEVLALAASAEMPSEHPLAGAILEAAGDRLLPVEGFETIPGKGVRARIDGREVLVGSLRFLEEAGVRTVQAEEEAREMAERGLTVVAVARDGSLVGLIGIADGLREDAREAVRQMQAVGMEPVLVTGDNRRTARAVASRVGISEVLAEVLPEEKAEAIRRLQRQGYRVAMVGDGINDAPALVQADVGIAIGAGTDIAIESADVILVGDRLTGVVEAYHIARESYAKTVQNVAIAFTFNGIGVPLAVTGLVHPVWAMVAMALSVTLVLLNSLPPLCYGPRLGHRRGG